MLSHTQVKLFLYLSGQAPLTSGTASAGAVPAAHPSAYASASSSQRCPIPENAIALETSFYLEH